MCNTFKEKKDKISKNDSEVNDGYEEYEKKSIKSERLQYNEDEIEVEVSED